ncbi:hypothetical protein [Naasia aerilata]|uniref:Uncharacterized protein n=1 Tax=Naasia aerilata TaxID=1162966 RepID=A0ABM8G9B9_9MICO|nr:hypothetical protein [Naasia aerilata]BDZ44786.1 hypothetical protein GCM10025866_06950 [Naasia aerilata]
MDVSSIVAGTVIVGFGVFAFVFREAYSRRLKRRWSAMYGAFGRAQGARTSPARVGRSALVVIAFGIGSIVKGLLYRP